MFSTSTNWAWSRLIILSVLLLSISSSAQIEKSAHFEIPLDIKDVFASYKVASANKYGLIVYRTVNSEEGPKIELSRLDTALNEVWHGFIGTEIQLNVLYAQVYENVLSILLKGANYASGDFLIINVTLEKGNFTTHLVKNAIPFKPTQYMVTASSALIGGYFNYRPLAVHFNFKNQQSKILPGFFNEQGELNQMKLNNDGSVDIIVSAKNYERKKCLWIRNYDSEGTLVKTVVLTPEEKKNFIFARSVQSINGEQIVCGVYGRYADYSRGVFVSVVNPVGEYTTRYYNFSELQNFFKYMKASREKRILNRIQRRKIKGKKIKFNYRMMVNDLLPYNDQFVMLGEAFFPHYTYANRSYNPYQFGGRYNSAPLARDGMIFDGFQYTHAIAIGFGENGKLLWDNSFEINDVRTMELEQFVKIQAERERIILLYLHENKLRSKIIKDSEVIEGKSEDNLTENEGKGKARIKDIEMSKLDHWYNQYFFAFGIQIIKDKPGSATPARKVFFIDKITYK